MFSPEGKSKCYPFCDLPYKTVGIPLQLYESQRGNYFYGRTPWLKLGFTEYAWAILYNPSQSDAEFYIDRYAVSNLSDAPVTSQAYISKKEKYTGKKSDILFVSNSTLIPQPKPKAVIEYKDRTYEKILDQANTICRIIPPFYTLICEENGRYIIPSGSGFMISVSTEFGDDYVQIDFGWWEKDLC